MNQSSESRLGWGGFMGLALTAMVTLMYEALLTRIFSVTMWYHFAFVVISVAMFGLSFGAVLVFLFPNFFRPERTNHRLALSAVLFSWGIVFSYLTHLSVPITLDLAYDSPILGIYTKALTFVAASTPFTLSGIAICLALTRFPGQVSKLYAADLAGAALGCLLMPQILDWIGDASSTVVVAAALAALGACFFAMEADSRRLTIASVASLLALAAFAVYLSENFQGGKPKLTTTWVKGTPEERNLYERWSSFARVTVQGDPNGTWPAIGWGLSPVYPKEKQLTQLALQIDSTAGTFMTKFDGDLSKLGHLKYDITNLAHYIRGGARVAIIGTGAGRDVLSAIAFNQKSIVGIEYNKNVLDALLNKFGDFSGHLDAYPQVKFVHDEGRSYLARQEEKFDIIQASFIDTWAATAAGAFVLAENTLYTLDAWKMFLDRLNPKGVMTFARWCNTAQMPSEMYRMTSLAAEALRRSGVKDPRRHILVATYYWRRSGLAPQGTGVILVGRDAFSPEDVQTLSKVCEAMQFNLELTPDSSADPNYGKLVENAPDSDFYRSMPVDLSPPTDNRPFFFLMLRFRDLVFSPLRNVNFFEEFNFKAITILVQLFFIVVFMTILCILVPLFQAQPNTALRGNLSFLAFFGAIGLGFMLVEISQMQRLIIYLGHPTYALTVILFTMLLASGAGSLSTARCDPNQGARETKLRFAGLLVALALYGLLTPYLLASTRQWENLHRAAVGFGMLFPIGFFMGMAFPLGMKLASAKAEALTPWLWGINGATSVCGSVLATAIALWAGFAVSFWTGFACYVAAILAFAMAARKKA